LIPRAIANRGHAQSIEIEAYKLPLYKLVVHKL
jgi:hypothetical protein